MERKAYTFTNTITIRVDLTIEAENPQEAHEIAETYSVQDLLDAECVDDITFDDWKLEGDE